MRERPLANRWRARHQEDWGTHLGRARGWCGCELSVVGLVAGSFDDRVGLALILPSSGYQGSRLTALSSCQAGNRGKIHYPAARTVRLRRAGTQHRRACKTWRSSEE